MEETKYFDIAGFPRPMTEGETAGLVEMFQSQGWTTFLKLRKIESDESMSVGMSLSASDEQRTMHRALYDGFQNDLTFEIRLRDGLRENKPVTSEQIEHLYQDLQQNP